MSLLHWRHGKRLYQEQPRSLLGPAKELVFVNDDIVLAKPSMRGILKGLFAEAHCCKKCKKIIVSFD